MFTLISAVAPWALDGHFYFSSSFVQTLEGQIQLSPLRTCPFTLCLHHWQDGAIVVGSCAIGFIHSSCGICASAHRLCALWIKELLVFVWLEKRIRLDRGEWAFSLQISVHLFVSSSRFFPNRFLRFWCVKEKKGRFELKLLISKPIQTDINDIKSIFCSISRSVFCFEFNYMTCPCLVWTVRKRAGFWEPKTCPNLI